MIKQNNKYCFVVDINNNPLSPTKTNKGWYLIRKKKAIQINKFPMTIKLFKEVNTPNQGSNFTIGIDDGSSHVGIAIVQECTTKTKVIFKGTIEQRQDVKHLMDVRRGYRRYKRYHKRYRIKRFSNRVSSKRVGRIAPSIKQKKDAILRVIKQLRKYIPVSQIFLEDVLIDIRALQEGKKLYKWQYQKSNRLDENLRKAVILRDNNTCLLCQKTNCEIDVHHITPKRLKGSNDPKNLGCLCKDCHTKVTGNEMIYAPGLYDLINGKNIRFDFAQHVMQGKSYLRQELNKIAPVKLTTGGDTANRRIDFDIIKTHSNDAVVITGNDITQEQCNIKDWVIKPMRRKLSKFNKHDELEGFKHRDFVKYTKKDGISYLGYVTALYPNKKQFNMTTVDGKVLKRYGIKPLELMWRFNKIYWFSARDALRV